jgi:hypothetical protein
MQLIVSRLYDLYGHTWDSRWPSTVQADMAQQSGLYLAIQIRRNKVTYERIQFIYVSDDSELLDNHFTV